MRIMRPHDKYIPLQPLLADPAEVHLPVRFADRPNIPAIQFFTEEAMWIMEANRMKCVNHKFSTNIK